MRIVGIILLIVGVVDVGGSFIGFDLWGDFIGIEFPYWVWYLTGYAELGIGYFLFNLGGSDKQDEEDPDN